MKDFFLNNIALIIAIEVIVIAGIANMIPIFLKHIKCWNFPIDGGKVNNQTGQRLLGDGKTWKGLIGGGLIGGVIGVIIIYFTLGTVNCSSYLCSNTYINSSYYLYTVSIVSFFISFFALIGDLVKSFFKRRKLIARGNSWIPFDQIDWIIGAIFGVILSDVMNILLFYNLFSKESSRNISVTVNILPFLVPGIIMAFLLHLFIKWLGFKLNIENKPL